MRIGTVAKSPEDRLDYDVRFDRWLSDGDEITDADAVADSEDITVESVGIFDEEKVVKVWLSGGVAGATYRITVTITTAAARVKELCFDVRVRGC